MLRKFILGTAGALALGGATLALSPAQAAPIAAGQIEAVQGSSDLLQEVQYYYGPRRYYGARRFYGPRYYGPRPYYGPRYYPPAPLFVPRPYYYGPRYLY